MVRCALCVVRVYRARALDHGATDTWTNQAVPFDLHRVRVHAGVRVQRRVQRRVQVRVIRKCGDDDDACNRPKAQPPARPSTKLTSSFSSSLIASSFSAAAAPSSSSAAAPSSAAPLATPLAAPPLAAPRSSRPRPFSGGVSHL